MFFITKLRNLAHNKSSIKWAKRFHISKFLRNLYTLVRFPCKKIVTLSAGGLKGKFRAERRYQLWAVEKIFLEKNEGELFILESMLEAIQEGDCILDIGANIGIYTVFLAQKVGPPGCVVAIEPEIHNFNRLKANIRLNSLTNVIPELVALGDSILQKKIYVKSVESTLIETNIHENVPSYFVHVMPGDQLIAQKQIPVPKILKIDVEGFEYQVVKGLRKTLSDRRCKMVCIEVHPRKFPKGVKEEDIFGIMESSGFNLTNKISRRSVYHSIFHK